MYLMIGAHTTCGDSTQGTRTWTEAEEHGALGGAGSPGGKKSDVELGSESGSVSELNLNCPLFPSTPTVPLP